MITLHQVERAFGSLNVLRGIDLTVPEGQITGVVGSNGAGKTTLFRCIAGLESFSGSIDPAPGLLKNRTGFLPTEPYFLPRITGREYLRLLCEARRVPVPDLDAANVFDLPLDRFAAGYSTGMRKKLAFLALVLQKNDLFILDEPFNGVDIQSNLLLLGLLEKLRRAGRTILMASHIFSTLQQTCDHIHLLEDGRIARSMNAAEAGVWEQETRERFVADRLSVLAL